MINVSLGLIACVRADEGLSGSIYWGFSCRLPAGGPLGEREPRRRLVVVTCHVVHKRDQRGEAPAAPVVESQLLATGSSASRLRANGTLSASDALTVALWSRLG